MPTISAEIANGTQTFEAPAGKKLVLAIEDAGIDILHRCGGNARCTTCRVEILSGEPSPKTEAEIERLGRSADLPDNVRLSCQVQVRTDLTVDVLGRLRANPDTTDPVPEPMEWVA